MNSLETLPHEILYEINKYLNLKGMKTLLRLNKRISKNIYIRAEIKKEEKKVILMKELIIKYIQQEFTFCMDSNFYIPYYNANHVISLAFREKKSNEFILSIAKYFNHLYPKYILNVFEIIHLSIKFNRLDTFKYINDINNYDELLIFDINDLLIESYKLDRKDFIDYLLNHTNNIFIDDILLKHLLENNSEEIDKLYTVFHKPAERLSDLSLELGHQY